MCPSGLVVFGAGCSLDAVPVRDGLNSTSTGTANAWDTWPTSLRGSRPYVVHVALLEPHALGGVLGQAHLGIRAPICVLSNTWGAASLRQQRFFGPPPLGCCPVVGGDTSLGFSWGCSSAIRCHLEAQPGCARPIVAPTTGTLLPVLEKPHRTSHPGVFQPRVFHFRLSHPGVSHPSASRPRCVPSLPCSPWLRVTARSGSVLWRTEGERPRSDGNGISPNGNLCRPRSPLNEAPNNRHVH